MARGVVHVVDPREPPVSAGRTGLFGRSCAADIAVLACREAIAARPGDAHAVLILGGGDARSHARSLGLHSHASVGSPLAHAGLAALALRRAVRQLGGAEVLQPWSERARLACRLAAGGAGAVAQVPIGVWPSFAQEPPGRRDRLRAGLRAPESLPLVALLADPARHADARRFVYLVGLLDVAGIPVAGVIDRRAAHVARARRFHAEAGVGWRMVLPDRPTARLLPACDIAVIVPPGVPAELTACERAWVAWSVLRSHLHGVPVVGGRTWLPDEAWPREGAPALEARSESATDIGRQLARIAADRGLLAALSAAVRGAATGFATRERFGEALGRLWDGVEGAEAGSALALER